MKSGKEGGNSSDSTFGAVSSGFRDAFSSLELQVPFFLLWFACFNWSTLWSTLAAFRALLQLDLLFLHCRIFLLLVPLRG